MDLRINSTGELAEPLPVPVAAETLNKRDGVSPTAIDQREAESTFTQMKGQFLIDREGVVRWETIRIGVEPPIGSLLLSPVAVFWV